MGPASTTTVVRSAGRDARHGRDVEGRVAGEGLALDFHEPLVNILATRYRIWCHAESKVGAWVSAWPDRGTSGKRTARQCSDSGQTGTREQRVSRPTSCPRLAAGLTYDTATQDVTSGLHILIAGPSPNQIATAHSRNAGEGLALTDQPGYLGNLRRSMDGLGQSVRLCSRGDPQTDQPRLPALASALWP